jgi:hypothetical protein
MASNRGNENRGGALDKLMVSALSLNQIDLVGMGDAEGNRVG